MERKLAVAALLLSLVLGLTGSAGAALITYQAALSGAAESPPVPSPGTGFVTVAVDTDAHTMHVAVDFADLVGTVTASHIHCCTALPLEGTVGVASPTPTFPAFPSGVTSGSYDRTFDLTLLSSFNAAFIAANGGTAASAEAALLAGLNEGRAYLNIHSTFAPGGEIRGFLQQQVAEPASLALLGLGLVALRRRASARRIA